MDAKTSDWRPGPTVCRCCLTEGCYKDISTEYFWMGKREVYSEMLSETLNVSIAYSQSTGPNSNSRLICEPCISRLRDATDFRRQVLECEKTFMNHLDPGSSILQNELQLSLHDVKLESVKQEKKNSDDEDFDERVDFIVDNDDDDDDDLDDEPLMKLATKVPKKEDNLINLLDKSQITVKRKAAAKGKEPPAKKAKKQIILKPTSSKIVTKTAKPTASASKAPEKKKKGPVSQIIWKPRAPYRKYNDERDNAALILECSNVCPFKWKKGCFGCLYCPQTSPEFGPIRNHIVEHQNRKYTVRVDRNTLLKADVTGLKCELCSLDMKNLATLVEHLIDVHQKALDKNVGPGIMPFLNGDVCKCAVCDAKFDLFINLNKHMNEHYPDNVCPLCGKPFSQPRKLNAHLRTHEKTTPVTSKCTKCNEAFTSVYLKNKHMMEKHNVLQHKCPYCGESFKTYTGRVKHIKQRHDKKIEYPCNLCSAVFLLCSQRTKHVKQVHIRDKHFACELCTHRFVTAACLRNHMIKHGGERKHKCQVCKKAYARNKTLKEHMRIHNNDKRFICTVCNSAYVQKCALKSHIKTHHSNQWPENRRPLVTV